MINCEKCSEKISFASKLKSFTNIRGDIKCTYCNTLYRPINNFHRFTYNFILSAVAGFLISITENPVKVFIFFIGYIVLLLLLNLIPQKWQKYIVVEKVDKSK